MNDLKSGVFFILLPFLDGVVDYTQHLNSPFFYLSVSFNSQYTGDIQKEHQWWREGGRTPFNYKEKE